MLCHAESLTAIFRTAITGRNALKLSTAEDVTWHSSAVLYSTSLSKSAQEDAQQSTAQAIVQQTWGLGECWLGLPLITEGILAWGHVHGWLQSWILLELLEQLLAGLLAISPSIPDALTPAEHLFSFYSC